MPSPARTTLQLVQTPPIKHLMNGESYVDVTLDEALKLLRKGAEVQFTGTVFEFVTGRVRNPVTDVGGSGLVEVILSNGKLHLFIETTARNAKYPSVIFAEESK